MLPTAPLVLPTRDDRTVRALRHKVRLVALRALLDTDDDALTERQARIAERAKREPGALLEALGAPDVLVHLLCAETGARPRIDAVRAALDALEAPPDVPRVALDARVPSLHLALADPSPLAAEEAHPDKSGNALDLGGHDLSEWRAKLGEALDAIHTALPDWHAELDVSLTRIVPVGWYDERHLSASFRESPGVAYLSLHPDVLTLAEAIIHETQHSKLNLLTFVEPVLINGYSTWTSSPVRPDLRPLMGVLLAVHAFVPVAALHLELARSGHPLSRTPRFEERRRDVLESNARGLGILREKAAPTANGRALLDALEALHRATATAR